MKLDKPVYLDQTILDVSKVLMYDFHYDYIKPKYGDKANCNLPSYMIQLVCNVENYKVPPTQGKEMKYDGRSGMKLMCLARAN